MKWALLGVFPLKHLFHLPLNYRSRRLTETETTETETEMQGEQRRPRPLAGSPLHRVSPYPSI